MQPSQRPPLTPCPHLSYPVNRMSASHNTPFTANFTHAIVHARSLALEAFKEAEFAIEHPGAIPLKGHTADDQVKYAKEVCEQLVATLDKSYGALKLKQTQMVFLLACFDAWKDAWDSLSKDWKELSKLEATHIHATEHHLLSILNWIVARPKGADQRDEDAKMTVASFDEPFLQEKEVNGEKITADAKRCFGNFKIIHSEAEFEKAIQHLVQVDQKLANIGIKAAGGEFRNTLFGVANKQELAKLEAEASKVEEEAELAEKADGALVEEATHQLEAAEGQFLALSFCIDGMASDIDKCTKAMETALAKVQKIQCEVSALRPWKEDGASSAVYDDFT